MFTGLVETTGRIESIAGGAAGQRLIVHTALGGELAAGDSVAVNGVCVTVVGCDTQGFGADLSPVTLSVTSLGAMSTGRVVNLERPVRADARMGGHFVLGHVDAVGRIVTWRADGESSWLEIDIPSALEPLVIPKGSIAIDGISLTIAALSPGRIGVQIVPFTRAHTSLDHARVGDVVNLEADVLGKYVARLLSTAGASGSHQAASLGS
jgi:riboflavin synthase